MNLFEKYLSIFHGEQLSQTDVDLPSDQNDWPEYWKEAYEERAAIMEYDGGMNRGEAEKKAERLIREEYGCEQNRS